VQNVAVYFVPLSNYFCSLLSFSFPLFFCVGLYMGTGVLKSVA
jgi:hypothetical protein